MATNGTSTPLRARIEGGGTPEMSGSGWYLRSETGTLRDVLLGPAESFRWLGLENAAWSPWCGIRCAVGSASTSSLRCASTARW